LARYPKLKEISAPGATNERFGAHPARISFNFGRSEAAATIDDRSA